jgi:hypothetical protein
LIVRLKYSPQPSVKKGLSVRIRCSKLTRYNTWQSRGICFNYDTGDIIVYSSADSSTVAHTYSLLSVAKVERIKRDDRQLRIKFRNKLSKDTVFRFDDPAEKEKFCMLAHFAAHDLEFSEDSHWDEGTPCLIGTVFSRRQSGLFTLSTLLLTHRRGCKPL